MGSIVNWTEPNGDGCLASKKIVNEKFKVGYMYREHPDKNTPDSGWRFFKGDEDDEYMGNPDNISFVSLDTVAQIDHDIVNYIFNGIGSTYIRVGEHTFEKDDNEKEIYMSR